MTETSSSSTCPTFRGYRAITEVIERMQGLGAWYQAFKPEHATITLRRRDLDLLQRWPKAAALHGVFTTEGVTYWRRFTLRADSSPPRYEKPWLAKLAPAQAGVTLPSAEHPSKRS